MELLNDIKKAWDIETCYPPLRLEWTTENPSLGQCAVTTLILQDVMGGKIMFNKENNHYWLQTDEGNIVDITADQFGKTVINYDDAVEVDREDVLFSDGAKIAETQKRYTILFNKIFNDELKPLTFQVYQQESSTTAIYLKKVYEKYGDTLPDEIYKILGISYVANGLGEVGEIQGKIKKIIRDAGGKLTPEQVTEIGKELGDVLWYVAAMCRELDIELDLVAKKNLEKLKSRQERGVLTGSGDNR